MHGPILNDVDERLTDAPPMAIRWTASIEPDRTVEAILGLNIAANFQDFRSSLSLYGAPAQNFVYADVDGHIGYQFPGYVPIRSNPDDRGDRPVRGDDGSGEWTGRIPYDDLPWQFDPEDGLIVTANNAAVDARLPVLRGPGVGSGLSRGTDPRADRPVRRRWPDRRGDGPDPERRLPARRARHGAAARGGHPDDRRRRHHREPDRRLGRRLRPGQPRLRRVECVASTACCATSSTTISVARPRLRRQPVLVGRAPPAARRPDIGMVGRREHGGCRRDLGRDRRPGDGRSRRRVAGLHRQPGQLVVGPPPQRDLPRGHPRQQWDRPARVVLQRRPVRRPRDRRSRQQHVHAVLLAPTPTRPTPTTSRSGSTTSST